jgi:hypothetical protein
MPCGGLEDLQGVQRWEALHIWLNPESYEIAFTPAPPFCHQKNLHTIVNENFRAQEAWIFRLAEASLDQLMTG